MDKTEAHKNAQSALDSLQGFTRENFPVGTSIFAPRGRGIASFKVSGFPAPTSLEKANSVIGTSENGKEQVIALASLVSEAEKSEVEARKEEARKRANEKAKQVRQEMRQAWEEKKAREAEETGEEADEDEDGWGDEGLSEDES